MPVLIIHDVQGAKNLYGSFKRDQEKNQMILKDFTKILIEEFIDWLYEDEKFAITQFNK